MDDTIPFFDKYLADFKEIIEFSDSTSKVTITLNAAELIEFTDKLNRVVGFYKNFR